MFPLKYDTNCGAYTNRKDAFLISWSFFSQCLNKEQMNREDN